VKEVVKLETRKLSKGAEISEDEVLNTDSWLPIFIYIVIKAQIKDLISHFRIMTEYVSKDLQKCQIGNVIASFLIAIYRIF